MHADALDKRRNRMPLPHVSVSRVCAPPHRTGRAASSGDTGAVRPACLVAQFSAGACDIKKVSIFVTVVIVAVTVCL